MKYCYVSVVKKAADFKIQKSKKRKLKKRGLVRKEPDNITLDRLSQAPATMNWRPSTDKIASILAHCCLQT